MVPFNHYINLSKIEDIESNYRPYTHKGMKAPTSFKYISQ